MSFKRRRSEALKQTYDRTPAKRLEKLLQLYMADLAYIKLELMEIKVLLKKNAETND